MSGMCGKKPPSRIVVMVRRVIAWFNGGAV